MNPQPVSFEKDLDLNLEVAGIANGKPYPLTAEIARELIIKVVKQTLKNHLPRSEPVTNRHLTTRVRNISHGYDLAIVDVKRILGVPDED